MASTRQADRRVTATASVASWAAFYDLLHPPVGIDLPSLGSLDESVVQVALAVALGCACRMAGFSIGSVGASSVVGFLIGAERWTYYGVGASAPRWERLSAASLYMTLLWVVLIFGWWLGRPVGRVCTEPWSARLRTALSFVTSSLAWGVPYYLWLTGGPLDRHWLMCGLVAAVSGGVLSARTGMPPTWAAATLLIGIVGANAAAHISDVFESIAHRLWYGTTEILDMQSYSASFVLAVVAGRTLAVVNGSRDGVLSSRGD